MNAGVRGQWPGGSMTAARIVATGTAEARSVAVPGPRDGHALVRMELAGICGTDLEILRGEASYVTEGRLRMPWTFGHEWTGTVVATCGPTGDLRPGRRVVGQTMVPCGRCPRCRSGERSACQRLREVGLYGLQGAAAQYVRMPAHALVPVPDEVDDVSAVLVEPAVTVSRALADARCSSADDVAVVGTGTIGLLSVMLASATARRVTAVGVDEAGLRLAADLGADRALSSGEPDGATYSLVVEASGTAGGLLEAVRLARTGGRVALVGVVGGLVKDFPAGEVTLRGLTLLGVRHGLDHYDRALQAFADGVLQAAPLVHSTHPLDRPQEAFAALAQRTGGRPKVLLTASA